jgi:hypothetical protein
MSGTMNMNRSGFHVHASGFVFRFVFGFVFLFGFLFGFPFGFIVPGSAYAEVTHVSIAARSPVADGQSFGTTGPYEKLTGTIAFALDPSDPHNRAIVDLEHAPRGADGKVRFTAELFVLQPVEQARGNGVLLFEISNRGTKGILQRFNRAPASNDPATAAHMGDGFLMREGYTIVWVGWQFDVAAPNLRVDAPAVDVRGRVRVSTIQNELRMDATLNDLPGVYAPVDANDPSSTLTVRTLFRDTPTLLPRSAWRFTSPNTNGRPRIVLDSGFEPGLLYELDYAATGARVAGVGFAAIRDAASAFRYRTDLPVRGRSAYVFGISQSGRFLRQFLHDGFNADERDRRAFDLVWPHIAGAGLGSFNERFALPGYSSFPATRFPYTDLEQVDGSGRRDGLLVKYSPALQPKVIYTNTPVEYWGQGRAAALTHTSVDGTRDLTLPDNVRSYLIAGTQHGEAAFPPRPNQAQELPNPMPQAEVMRALLRAAHRWVSGGSTAPGNAHPTVRDGTLTALNTLSFPALRGVTDPRLVEGPLPPLPFLVPQVDRDGNDLAGIRVPEVAVPLATTTGWNFRSERIGSPKTIVALTGSYIPFARTRADREAAGDPRPSIEERYRGKDDYLARVRAAAVDLIKRRFMLEEDLPFAVDRASRHWDWAVAR